MFNWLSGRLAKYEAGLAHAKSELVDTLESGAKPSAGAGAELDGAPGYEDAPAVKHGTAVPTTA
jgi:hypothetical protein